MRVEVDTEKKEKTIILQFPVRDMLSDRISFKPYGVVVGMENVYLSIDVPEQYVVEKTADKVVLTLEGIVWISDKIAAEIEKVHTKWLQSHQR